MLWSSSIIVYVALLSFLWSQAVVLSIYRDQYHQGTEDAVSMPWIMPARLTELLEKIAAVEKRASLIPLAAARAIWVILLCIAQCSSWLSNGCFLVWVSYSWKLLCLALIFKRLCDISASHPFIIYPSAFLSLPFIRKATVKTAAAVCVWNEACSCWQQEHVAEVCVQQHGETMTEQVR